MPYEIRELLAGLPKPITAEPNEPLSDALNRMLAYNYSQLPVIQRNGQSIQFYMITANRILEQLNFLGWATNAKRLTVAQVCTKVQHTFKLDDTITEVMDGLKERDAVLIVNDQGELEKIVTIYDTTHFFRQWSEDLLHARDVEMTLRNIINGSFKRSDGSVDQVARQKAIDGASSDDSETSNKNSGLRRFREAVKVYLTRQAAEGIKLNRRAALEAFAVLLEESQASAITGTEPNEHLSPTQSTVAPVVDASVALPASARASSLPPSTISNQLTNTRDLRHRFEAAVQRYLELTALSPEPNSDWLNSAYRQHYQDKQEPRQFNKLPLGAYIELFFHEQCWGRCGEVFNLDQEVVKHVLKDVQNIRNLLAHFRDEEITEEHRRNLRLAAAWMPQYEKVALAKLDATAPPSLEEVENLSSLISGNETDEPVVSTQATTQT